ncbi:MAG TPA: response regulator [Gemmatimonadales bacterium]
MTARILVIDDEPMVRALIVRVLTDEGYEVSAASRREEALDLAVGTRFDLVVTNSWLRGMPGTDVITELRRDFPGTPILHRDDLPQSSRSSPGIANGAPVLYKPFSITGLLSAVRAAFDGGKAVRAEAISPRLDFR